MARFRDVSVAHPPLAVTFFDEAPRREDVPARLASPFHPGPPAPLARKAAEALQQRLKQGPWDALWQPGGGKMFGVLVVAEAGGRLGYLCAFSGMLDGAWNVEGFAPPLFDPVARAAFLPSGEAELAAWGQRLAEQVREAEQVRSRLAALSAEHERVLAGMGARHAANRALRHEERGPLEARLDGARLQALEQESRADTAERRALEAAHEAACEPLRAALREVEARRAEVEHLRAERSRALWWQVAHSYVIPNARGERLPLAALFAPRPPPGGAGDCAAPKLLAQAYRHHLRPLALAEFWWGMPPLDGRRQPGGYYPACESKCGAVLPYMLQGLSVDPAPRTASVIDDPRLLHEDPWLLVVDKPVGLPSLPGRHAPGRDSVLVRLLPRFPALSGPLFIHDLEPEASGLLLIARDPATQAALLRQFARREAEHRHVAWVEGHVEADAGVIELPLRGTSSAPLEDCVDRVHGKRAVTAWKALRHDEGRTRVELVSVTRHPHQLRIHAAHRLGLGAPIVGDTRFGREDTRLMLHAEALTFTHPQTGERRVFTAPAPF
ncbi:RluA family pseudouridine synthase [Corallococcus sp. CA053C]|nr:RluA family pseudouridine synthase [Corallococcus sp. CA053C]